MTHILRIDEYYNKYRGINKKYGSNSNWSRKIRLGDGDDDDVITMHEPNHSDDCIYRGYKIRNCDCTGGFQFQIDNGDEDVEDIIGISYMFDIDNLKKRIDDLIGQGKLPDLSKDENGNDVVMYKWLDYFNDEWCETPCSVLSDNGKTVMIKLLDDGPRGKSKGSQMRVRLTSLVGYKK